MTRAIRAAPGSGSDTELHCNLSPMLHGPFFSQSEKPMERGIRRRFSLSYEMDLHGLPRRRSASIFFLAAPSREHDPRDACDLRVWIERAELVRPVGGSGIAKYLETHA